MICLPSITGRSGFYTACGCYRVSLAKQEGPILTKKTFLITGSFAMGEMSARFIEKIVDYSLIEIEIEIQRASVALAFELMRAAAPYS